jgi:hypothetical protein
MADVICTWRCIALVVEKVLIRKLDFAAAAEKVSSYFSFLYMWFQFVHNFRNYACIKTGFLI